MKLNIFLFILINLFTKISWSQVTDQNSYQLYCTGSRGKVYILFEQVNDKMRFTYTNSEGRKDFPFYEGVVTEQALPYLKIAKKELNVIDNRLVLEWKIDQCKIPTADSMIITCDGEANIVFPTNSELTSYTLSTSRIFEQTPSFKFEIFKLNLGLDSKDMHFLISMPFDPSKCYVKNPENLKNK